MIINKFQRFFQYIQTNLNTNKNNYIDELPIDVLKVIFIYANELEVKNVSKKWNKIVKGDEKIESTLIVKKLVDHFQLFFKENLYGFQGETKYFTQHDHSVREQLKKSYQGNIVSTLGSITYEKNLGNLTLHEVGSKKELLNRREIILHGIFEKSKDPNYRKSIIKVEESYYIPIDRIDFTGSEGSVLPNKISIAIQISLDKLNCMIQKNKFSKKRFKFDLIRQQQMLVNLQGHFF